MLNNFEMPEAEPSGFIPTLNKTGYMTSTLDSYSKAFVEFATLINDKVLEIGAAYGIATLKALEEGARVIANDIDERHLEILYKNSPIKHRDRLTLLPGSFPEGLHMNNESVSGILISRVLHFFDGQTIEQSLRTAYGWLKQKGKLFIVAETPYTKNWADFMPEYERRLKVNDKWPGLVLNSSEYTKVRLNQIPKMVHWLDKKVLMRAVQEAGFYIEKIDYINRIDFPEDVKLDGRESIGAIAVKL